MGKFIVFEGIDGSGKSTQIKKLAERLEAIGEKVYITAEPTISLSGGILRDALSGEVKRTPCELAVLFTWDRINHNINKTNGIAKMLAEGYTVISDRYYYSSLAYQGATTDYEWVRTLNCSCPEIRKPDLCIFLDLTPDTAIQRINHGRATTEIFEKKEILEKFRNKFFDVFTDLANDPVAIIDASGTVDDVSDVIFVEVSKIIH